MTVGTSGRHLGELLEVTNEQAQAEFVKVDLKASQGRIQADLSIGADVLGAQPLRANQLLAGTGLILGGRGFVLNEDEAKSLKQRNAKAGDLIFPLRNGEDINGKGRNLYVIDTDGWSEADLRLKAPEIYQRLRDTVYAERQSNR